MEPIGGSSTRFDVNLEANSTAFLGQRPLAAISRARGDGASAKDGVGSFELRPSLRTKLLAAFLVIEALLVSVGRIGLLALRESDRHAYQIVALQHKIEAYRQVQHDTLRQLYGVSAALASPNETTLASALRQINQFGYDLDRVSFVAKDEVALLDQVREEYARFIAVVSHVIDLIRNGRAAERAGGGWRAVRDAAVLEGAGDGRLQVRGHGGHVRRAHRAVRPCGWLIGRRGF